jgi:hypothetical protein
MKNLKLALLSIVALTVVSCNPCVTCTSSSNNDSEQICREEFESQEEYEDAINALELLTDYECN